MVTGLLAKSGNRCWRLFRIPKRVPWRRELRQKAKRLARSLASQQVWNLFAVNYQLVVAARQTHGYYKLLHSNRRRLAELIARPRRGNFGLRNWRECDWGNVKVRSHKEP